MSKSIINFAIFLSLGLISYSPQLLASPNLTKENNLKQAKSTPIYQKAKEELSDDLYTSYRIIDRIARANGLENTPWRIIIVSEYHINAFATEANLIALYDGILDQLAGDASAIACVIGHEMAHHTERHIALSPAEELKIRKHIQQEAEAEVRAEAKDARADATTTAVGGSILRTGGGLLGGLGGVIGNTGGSVLENESRNRMNQAEQRIEQIVTLKEQELNESIAETSRKHEFEADEFGYLYMAKAGFEPEGCLRVMKVLGRTPGAELDTTHPAIPKRIDQIQELMKENPPQTLAEEGKKRIATSQPLTYDKSKDGMSLRINSSRGGSSSDDLERLFGE